MSERSNIPKGFDPRSRTGSDGVTWKEYDRWRRFRSTLPHGERPAPRGKAKALSRFRSTLPHGERLRL